jgi:hypothetical protein
MVKNRRRGRPELGTFEITVPDEIPAAEIVGKPVRLNARIVGTVKEAEGNKLTVSVTSGEFQKQLAASAANGAMKMKYENNVVDLKLPGPTSQAIHDILAKHREAELLQPQLARERAPAQTVAMMAALAGGLDEIIRRLP